jgi:hypothetical protein
MVLRKQTGNEIAFLDEIVPQIEQEAQTQLKSMLELDDKEDPNFEYVDYQLAAYAAALRILTSYQGHGAFTNTSIRASGNRITTAYFL